MRRSSDVAGLRRSSLLSLNFGADSAFHPEGDLAFNFAPGGHGFAKGGEAPHSPDNLLDLVLEEDHHHHHHHHHAAHHAAQQPHFSAQHMWTGFDHSSQHQHLHQQHQQLQQQAAQLQHQQHQLLQQHMQAHAQHQAQQSGVAPYPFDDGPFASLDEHHASLMNFSRQQQHPSAHAQLDPAGLNSKKRKQDDASTVKKQKLAPQFSSLCVTPSSQRLALSRATAPTIKLEDGVSDKALKSEGVKKTVRPTKRSRAQSSRFRGVSKCSKDGRWQARIRVGPTVKYLGRFKVEEDAARRYDEAAAKLHGKRAQFNFPQAA